MARIHSIGFETQDAAGGAPNGPDNMTEASWANNAPSFSTTAPRSGAASGKCDSAGGNVASQIVMTFGYLANSTYFGRAYIRFEALPGSTIRVFQIGDFTARLTSTGVVQLFNEITGLQIGSDSVTTVSTGIYYRFEIKIVTGAAAVQTAVELQLDGVSVASTSGLSLGVNNNFTTGWINAPGANKVCYVDDIALNDATGAANTSWPGSGKVILMKPVSDNARGAFTGGAGGTTNLWDAVNNTPPVGVAEASATNTSQIKNRTTTNPTNCDLNLNSYTTEGLLSGDTVNAIQVWTNTGEDPATGIKAGTCAMVSNPAIAASASFNYGNNAGLQGTYVGNWFWSNTAVSDAPSVTLGTQPVIRITCTSGATASRSASCDFLGAYVDYTPAVSGSLPTEIVKLQAVNRAGTY